MDTENQQLMFPLDDASSGIIRDVVNKNFFIPILSKETTAPVNSIFYSTDSSKLVYKDNAGAIHALY